MDKIEKKEEICNCLACGSSDREERFLPIKDGNPQVIIDYESIGYKCNNCERISQE